MKKLLEKMIIRLHKQVEEKVPECGAFPVVYEQEDVSEWHIGLSHLILKVSDVRLQGKEAERVLEIAGLNHPSPYGAEIVVTFGSTQDILALLQKEGLADELMKKVAKLANDLDD